MYAPCRDLYLKLSNFLSEWDGKIQWNWEDWTEHLYDHSRSGYKVGTYLETYIKMKTKFKVNFKNDKAFREAVWKKLDIKETCPE